MHPVEHSQEDTWKGRTVMDEDGKRWPDIDDERNWEPVPGQSSAVLGVGVSYPYNQLLEQIMYGKGLSSFQAAVEVAIQALHANLSEEELKKGLDGMLQAGLDSGEYPGNPFEEAYAELRKQVQDRPKVA